MSHISMILTALMTMSLLVFVAPNIFALNRGHILRNVALWLAIFLGLALFYQNFGPSSAHPIFQVPSSMMGMNKVNMTKPSSSPVEDDKDKDNSNEGEQGFTPPKE